MRQKNSQSVCLMILVLLIPVPAMAGDLEEATKQAAKQNDAKVLSAKTVKQGNGQAHEIKLLTKKGVVKTVRVPDNNKKKKKRK